MHKTKKDKLMPESQGVVLLRYMKVETNLSESRRASLKTSISEINVC
jgi:hypothetical protein